jgi:hypothetical protein
MRGFRSLRRVCLQAVLLLLAVSVFTLATEAKTAQYRSEHLVTSLCKATDGSAKLKFCPACEMACVPTRQNAPVLRAERVPFSPGFIVPDPESFSTANPLRAPPAF